MVTYKDEALIVENFQRGHGLCVSSHLRSCPGHCQPVMVAVWECGFRCEKLGAVSLSGVCPGTSMACFTLSVTSRWNSSTWVGREASPSLLSTGPIFLSLPTDDATPGSQMGGRLPHLASHGEVFHFALTHLGLCLFCSKAGKVGTKGRKP